MKKVAVIDQARCDGSPACPAMRACPLGAIKKEGSGLMAKIGFGKAVVDKEKCTGCGRCVQFCPMKIIKMVDSN